MPRTYNGWLILAASIAYGASLFVPLLKPLPARPDFNCNHEPSCCQPGKNWLHKYDCETLVGSKDIDSSH